MVNRLSDDGRLTAETDGMAPSFLHWHRDAKVELSRIEHLIYELSSWGVESSRARERRVWRLSLTRFDPV